MNSRLTFFPVFHVFAALIMLGGYGTAAELFESPGLNHARADYETAVQEARQKYLAQLQIALKESTAAGQLVEANRISREIAKLTEEPKAGAPVQGQTEAEIRRSFIGRWKAPSDAQPRYVFNANGKAAYSYKGITATGTWTIERLGVVVTWNTGLVDTWSLPIKPTGTKAANKGGELVFVRVK